MQELSIPDLRKIDHSWTVFIDRDGVINYEKKNDYIYNTGEFRFYEGVEKAFHKISQSFGRIIIVTNQRGVGKGLMSLIDLHSIHGLMEEKIVAAGGRIDGIYYCTSIDNDHPDRKPNPGMALNAKADFPEIEFHKSIMLGNKPSDMLFGRNAGMFTAFIATTHPETPFPHPNIDFRFISLPEFAKAL